MKLKEIEARSFELMSKATLNITLDKINDKDASIKDIVEDYFKYKADRYINRLVQSVRRL